MNKESPGKGRKVCPHCHEIIPGPRTKQCPKCHTVIERKPPLPRKGRTSGILRHAEAIKAAGGLEKVKKYLKQVEEAKVALAEIGDLDEVKEIVEAVDAFKAS